MRCDQFGNPDSYGEYLSFGNRVILESEYIKRGGLEALEHKSYDDDDDSIFEGYPCRYRKNFQPMTHSETFCFVDGCFADSLKKIPVTLQINHELDFTIGSTKDGSLEIFDDSGIGLAFRARLPNNIYGAGMKSLIRSGACSATSLGFHPIDWSIKDGIHYVTDAVLSSISLVNAGADDFAFVVEAKNDGRSLAAKCRDGSLLATGYRVKYDRAAL